MSLVNKMLRDLDARRAGDAERGVLPTAVTPIEAESPPHRRLTVLLALAVLAAAGIAAIVSFLPAADPPLPPTAIKQNPQLVSTQAVEQASETAVSAPPPVPPVAPASALPPVAREATAHADAPATLAGIVSPSLKLDASLMAAPPEAPKQSGVPKAPAAKPSVPLATLATQATPVAVPPRAAAVVPVVKASPGNAESARPAAPPAPEGQIEKHERKVSPAEKAEAEYRRGQIAQRQGSTDEAMARYRQALVDSVDHIAARQSLAGLLIERRRFDEAEEVLRGGRALFPLQPHWPMTLARLKVERGDAAAALDILQKQAVAGEASADFQGFHGALLQRAGRAGEAAERYAAATRLAPNEARWWAGMGIALEGAGRPAEARSAYERARSLPGLPAELAAYVEQRLGVR